MDIVAEREIRERAGYLALAWHEERFGPFMGNSADEFGEMIVAAHITSDESRIALQRWVDAGRRAGLSWAEIGGRIGISKQAAQQRFGGADPEKPAPGQGGEITLRAATAFGEMRILDEQGRKGHELVRTGALALVFRETRKIWEYRRVVAISADTARTSLAGEDWAYVSSWFPFHYFKRVVGPLSVG